MSEKSDLLGRVMKRLPVLMSGAIAVSGAQGLTSSLGVTSMANGQQTLETTETAKAAKAKLLLPRPGSGQQLIAQHDSHSSHSSHASHSSHSSRAI
jgi:hypothetical protein